MVFNSDRCTTRRDSAARCSLMAFGVGLLATVSAAHAGGPIAVQPIAGQPLVGLTPAQLALFDAGRERYTHVLTTTEGLGPTFNQTSCGGCHANPVGATGSIVVHRFGFSDGMGGFDPLPGGSLLQEQAISVKGVPDCHEYIPPEANVHSRRVTNGSIAYGLVEAIPDSALLAHAALGRGTAHMVPAFEDDKGAPLRVGRFGWKAQVATVLTFSADAGLNELGLTNRFVTEENAPNGNTALLAQCDLVADPEDSTALGGAPFQFIDRITHFQRYLAAPPQTPKSGMTGETLFMQIGCGTCHVPSFTTSRRATGASDVTSLEPAIAGKTIKTYGDFLLHNMGLLGDGIVQGTGTQERIKTAPLWGVRFRRPIIHDGRVPNFQGHFAEGIIAAVEWHNVSGSDAAPSAARFLSGLPICLLDPNDPAKGYDCGSATGSYPVVAAGVSPAQRAKIVAFLDSLGRREFDPDGNGSVDLADFQSFHQCFGGGPYSADDICAVHDINQDGFVTLADYQAFASQYSGINGDCNGNGVQDLQDILVGTSLDRDLNGFPDECLCTGDLDGNFEINSVDLGILLVSWSLPATSPGCGGFQPCVADLNGDGFVNSLDLGMLLVNWGLCY